MRAILVDPFARTVEEIETDGGIKNIYSHIKADCFCVVGLDEKGNVLYLDDNGLSAEGQEFFAIGSYPQPLAGRGLILGCDEEGESCSTDLPLSTVRGAVRWLSPQQAINMNADAVAEMHRQAAEQEKAGNFVHVAAPMLEIDPETGKARAL